MAGIAVMTILAAMAGNWLFRGLLLRELQTRHPDVFSELGRPSAPHLASIHPRHAEMQIRFWKYLWGGSVFSRRDKRISCLAVLAMLADVGLAVGVVALIGSAAG
jgi:hypothetical protein